MPMKFRISSEYGALEEVRSGREHHGVDLAMPKGTELHSIAPGTVERVVDYGSENIGKGVIVRTDTGELHVYGHMDRVSVDPGDHLAVGDLIGLSGNTGHSSGPHLHFGLIRDGKFADSGELVSDLQHFSGDKPGLFDMRGSALRLLDGAQDHVQHSIRDNILEWLQAAAGVVLDLSYCIALIGCGLLLILGVLGLRDGYRWSGVLFGSYSLVKLLLGGAVR
ncbi:M23 family metallopeptidase [Paenibacillus shunpengii]|uniref:M23 family metallopeptidase n=1 Tax=Paenibacillus shunpengii TaxID=2054424 RepID=A0ABW5SVW9_9BACL